MGGRAGLCALAVILCLAAWAAGAAGQSDTTPPALHGTVAPTLDTESGTLVITFSERISHPVRQDKISITDGSTKGGGTQLTSSQLTSADNLSTITIVLDKSALDDVNSYADPYIHLEAGTVADAAFNTNTDASARLILLPVLDSVAIDLNNFEQGGSRHAGKLTLTFDQNIEAHTSSADALGKITVREEGKSGGTTLDSTSSLSISDAVATIGLSPAQKESMKDITGLSPAQKESMKDTTAGVEVDIAANAFKASGTDAALATVTKSAPRPAADTTGPVLVSASVDEGTGVLDLNFDEHVGDGASVDLAKIFVRDGDGAGGTALSGSAVTSVVLADAQIRIKLTEALRQSVIGYAEPHVRLEAGVTKDFSNNNGPASSATEMADTPDAVKPEVESASLDGGTGVLTVTFDETVDVSGADGAGFEIRPGSDAADGSAGEVPLSAAEVQAGQSDGLTLRFLLSEANRQAVLAMAGPHLYVAAGAISDVISPTANAIAAETDGVAVGIGTDGAAPAILSAEATAPDRITVTFSETVKTADQTGLGWSISGTDSASRHVTASSDVSSGSTTVVLTLSGDLADTRPDGVLLRYETSGTDVGTDAGSGSGTVTDSSSNALAARQDVPVSDRIAPVFEARITADRQVTVVFSEPVQSSDNSFLHWEFSQTGGQFSAPSPLSASSLASLTGSMTVDLNMALPLDASGLSVVYLGVGTVSDASGNRLAAASAPASDYRAPEISSAAAVAPDTVVVSLSQPAQSSSPPADLLGAWSVSGGDAAGNSVLRLSSLTVLTSTLTLTLGSDLPDTAPDGVVVHYDSTPSGSPQVRLADANGTEMADQSARVSDRIAPSISSAVSRAADQITVTFSEPVSGTATAPGSTWTLSGAGAGGRTVTAYEAPSQSDQTVLTVSSAFPSPIGEVTLSYSAGDIADPAGLALSGSAPVSQNLAPTVSSARATSLNTITVTFSERVSAPGTNAQGWSISGTDADGLAVDRSTALNGNRVTLTLSGNLADTNPDNAVLRYKTSAGDVGSDADSGSGAIADSDSNALAARSGIPIQDGIRPTLSAKTKAPNIIEFTFSEPVTRSAHDAVTDFPGGCNLARERTPNDISQATDTITVTSQCSSFGSSWTGTHRVSVNWATDAAGLTMFAERSRRNMPIDDGIPPSITGVTATSLTTVRVTFDENVRTSDITGKGWSISGTDSASRTVDSSTALNGNTVTLELSGPLPDTKPDGLVLRYETSGADVGADAGSGGGDIRDRASSFTHVARFFGEYNDRGGLAQALTYPTALDNPMQSQSASVSDGIAPAMLLAESNGTDKITVTFSEPVSATATAPGSTWTLSGAGAGGRAITGYPAISDSGAVVLTVSPAFSVPIGEVRLSYDASAGDVKDAADIDLAGSSVAVTENLAPTISSAVATAQDKIRVTFSEPLTVSDTTAQGWSISGTDAAGLTVDASTAASSADSIVLTLSGNMADTKPDGVLLRYETSGTDVGQDSGSGSGAIADSASNALAARQNIPVSDGAAPAVLSATATSRNSVWVLFSEDVRLSGAGTAPFGWTISGADADGAEVSSISNIAESTPGTGALLHLDGDIADTTRPSITVAYSGGNVEDTSGNDLARYAATAAADGIAPTVTAEATALNKITVTFSEPLTISDTTAQGWSISGTDASNLTVDASTATSTSDSIVLTLSGNLADTDPDNAVLRYKTEGGDVGSDPGSGAGAITDLASNALAARSSIPVSDGLAPQVSSSRVTGPNQITVSYGEAVTAALSDYGSVLVEGAPRAVSAISGETSASHVLSFTGHEAGTGATGSLSIGAAGVLDASGNALGAGALPRALGDGQAPAVLSAKVTDRRTIEVAFSEEVGLSEAGTAPFGWTISGADANGAAVDSISGITESVSGTTATLALDGDIADTTRPSITVAYSGGNIEDASGNDLATYAATAAGDGIKPTVTAEATAPNEITVTFSEDLTITDETARGWSISGTDADGLTVDASTATSTSDSIVLTLSGNLADTDPDNAVLRYRTASIDLVGDPGSGGGAIADPSLNLMEARQDIPISDGIAPTVTAEATAPNEITVTFSEDLTISDESAQGWSISGADAGGLTVDASTATSTSDSIVLTLSGNLADTNPDNAVLRYKTEGGDEGSDLNSGSGAITDLASNALAARSSIPISDGLAPSFEAGITGDRTVIVEFGEQVSGPGNLAGHWAFSHADGSFSVPRSLSVTSLSSLTGSMAIGLDRDMPRDISGLRVGYSGSAVSDASGNALPAASADVSEERRPAVSSIRATELDKIAVEFTSPVKSPDSPADLLAAWSVSGGDAASPASLSVQSMTSLQVLTSSLTLTLSSDLPDTKPDGVILAYDGSAATIESGGGKELEDLSGPVEDGISPTVTARATGLNRIAVTFSEPLTIQDTTAQGWSVSGTDAAGRAVDSSTAASSADSIVLTLDGNLADTNPDNAVLRYETSGADVGSDTGSGSGAVADLASNALEARAGIPISDGVAPTISATTALPNKVAYRFSEAVSIDGSFAIQTFRLSPGCATGTTSISTLASQNFVTFTSNCNISSSSSGSFLYDGRNVRDLAGNRPGAWVYMPIDDGVAPSITGARAASATTIQVTFDEDVSTSDTAGKGWSISGADSASRTVDSSTSLDGRTVTLTLSGPLPDTTPDIQLRYETSGADVGSDTGSGSGDIADKSSSRTAFPEAQDRPKQRSSVAQYLTFPDAAVSSPLASRASIPVADGIAPRIVSAEATKPDEITVGFSEAVRMSDTGAPTGWTISGTDAASVSVSSITDISSTQSGTAARLLLSGNLADTSPDIAVAYSGGNIEDIYDNALAAYAAAAPSDGIAPTFAARATAPDKITVTFSESLTVLDTSAQGWSISGTDAAGLTVDASTAASDGGSIVLTLSGNLEGTRPEASLRYKTSAGDEGGDANSGSGTVADSSSNAMAAASAPVSDGIAPAIASAVSHESNKITVEFSEEVSGTATDPDDTWSLSGAGAGGRTITVYDAFSDSRSIEITASSAFPEPIGEVTLSYSGSAGDIADASGNGLAGAGISVSQNLAPAISSAAAVSADEIRVEFSEDVTGTATGADGTWKLHGADSAGITVSRYLGISSSTDTVSLGLSGDLPDTSPSLRLQYVQNPGDIKDGTDKPLASTVSPHVTVSDLLPPALLSAVLNESSGELALEFSEDVDVSSADASKFYIRESGASSGGTSLAGRLDAGQSDGTSVAFTLTSQQLAAVLALSSPEIDIDAGAVSDTASPANPILASQDNRVAALLGVESAAFDGDFGDLTITLNRIAKASAPGDIDETLIGVRDGPSALPGSPGAFVLDQDSTFETSDTASPLFQLSEDQKQAVLAMADPRLYVSAGAFRDADGDLSVQADGVDIAVTADTVAPTLPDTSTVRFDAGTGALTAKFDEYIDVAGLSATGVHVRQGTEQITMEQAALDLSSDTSIVRFELDEDTRQEVVTMFALASADLSVANPALYFDAGVVRDTSGNAFVPFGGGYALNPVSDSTPPVPASASYDGSKLTVTFSETVRVSSVDASKFHIRESGSSSGGMDLSGRLDSGQTDGVSIKFTLTAQQRASFEALSSPELDIEAGAVTDKTYGTDNAIAASDDNPVTLSLFVRSASFDGDFGELTITLSTTAKASAAGDIDETLIGVRDGPSALPGSPGAFVLTQDSTFETSDTASPVFQLSGGQKQAVLAMADPRLYASAGAFRDADGDLSVPADGVDIAVTADTVAPTLPDTTTVRFDAGTGALTAKFDEYIDVAGLSATGVHVRQGTEQITMEQAALDLSSDTSIVRFELDEDTRQEVVTMFALASADLSVANPALYFDAGVVRDTSGNAFVPFGGGYALNPVSDSTPPVPASASYDGALTVVFSETVRISSVDASKFHIRESGSSSGGIDLSGRLDSGQTDGVSIKFTLTAQQRASFEALSSPELDIGAGAVTDKTYGTDNSIAASDDTPVTLALFVRSAAFDGLLGDITVTLSKAAKISAPGDIDETLIGVRDGPSALPGSPGSFVLTQDSTFETSDTASPLFELDEDQRQLVIAMADPRLYASAGAFRDADGDLSVQADGVDIAVSPDTDAPRINNTSDIKFYKGTGELSVTFNEYVDVGRLSATSVHLRDGANQPATGQITMSAALLAVSSNTSTVRFELDEDRRQRAVTMGNPNLYFVPNTIYDTSGNAFVPSSNGHFIVQEDDSIAPLFASASYDGSALTVTFSETVRASSVDDSKFDIRESGSSSGGIKLTGRLDSGQSDGVSIKFTLTAQQRASFEALSSPELDIGAGAVTDKTDETDNAIAASDDNPVTLALFVRSAAFNGLLGDITVTLSKAAKISAPGDIDETLIGVRDGPSALPGSPGSFVLTQDSTFAASDTASPLFELDEDQRQLVIAMADPRLYVAAGAFTDADGSPSAEAAGIDVSVSPDTDAPRINNTSDIKFYKGTGELSVTFNEYVDVGRLSATSVHLRDGANQPATGQITMSAALLAVSSNTSTVRFELDEDRRQRAVTMGNPNLYFVPNTIYDTSGNAFVPSSNGHFIVQEDDSIAPLFASASYHGSDGVLTVTFSETVRASSVDDSKFDIRESGSSSGGIKLTGRLDSGQSDGVSIKFTLTAQQRASFEALSSPELDIGAGAVTDKTDETDNAIAASDDNPVSDLTTVDSATVTSRSTIAVTFSDPVRLSGAGTKPFGWTISGTDAGGASVESIAGIPTINAGVESRSSTAVLTLDRDIADTTKPDIAVAYSGNSIRDNSNRPLADYPATAAGDGIAPTVTAEATALNEITVTFSEDLTVLDTSAQGWSISGTDAAGLTVDTSTATSVNRSIVLTLSGNLADTNPDNAVLRYETSGTDVGTDAGSGSGAIADLASNALAPRSSIPVSDGLPPTVTAEATARNSITVTFSESLTIQDTSAQGWSISGTDAAGLTVDASSAASGSNSVVLTLSGNLADTNPDNAVLRYETSGTDIGTDAGSGSGAIADPSSNAVEARAGIPVSDGIAPTVYARTEAPNKAVSVFSEDVSIDNFAIHDVRLNGQANCAGGTTLTAADRFTFASRDCTVNPSWSGFVQYDPSGVRDLAGNVLSSSRQYLPLDDGVAPSITAAKATSATTIEVTFDEDVSTSDLAGKGWSVSGADSASRTVDSSTSLDGNTVTLTLSGPLSDTKPDIQLRYETSGTDVGADAGSGDGDIADKASKTSYPGPFGTVQRSSVSQFLTFPAASPANALEARQSIPVSDGIAPTISSAAAVSLTEIRVTFSEPLSISDATAQGWSVSGTDAGSHVVVSSTTSSGSDSIVLTLDKALADTKPDGVLLRYETSGTDLPGDPGSGSGAIEDPDSNALAARQGIPVSDGIAPTAEFRLTSDDAITVSFSEPVSSSDNDASHWTLSGADAAGLAVSSVSSLTSTTGSMTISLSANVPVPSTDLKLAYSAAGTIQDGSNLALAAVPATAVQDDRRPSIVSATAVDRDTIVVEFTRGVSSSDSPSDLLSAWSISGGDAASPAVLSISGASSLSSLTSTLRLDLSSGLPDTKPDGVVLSFDSAPSQGTTVTISGTDSRVLADASVDVADGIAPEIESASIVGPTTMEVAYGESVTAAQADYLSATVDGAAATVSGLANGSTDRHTVTFSTASPVGTGATGSVSIDAAAVTDAAGNALGSATVSQQLADGQKPTITSARATSLTTIEVTFSEDVKATGTSGAAGWSISGGDSASRLVNTRSDISATASDTLVLTLNGNLADTKPEGVKLAYDSSAGDVADEAGTANELASATNIDVSDAVKPTIESARATSLTTIEVTFSEDVKATGTSGAAGWSISGGDSASRLVNTRSDISATASDTLVLTLNGNLADTKPEGVKLAYDSSAGDVADEAGTANELASATNIDVSDGVKPTIESARATSLTTIEVTFSEDVKATGTSGAAGWSISGGDSASRLVNTRSDISATASDTLVLTLNGNLADTKPEGVKLAYDSSAGDVADEAGTANELASATNIDVSDGIAPTLTARATSLTTIEITFSEPVDASAANAQGWSISGTDAPSLQVVSSTATSSGLSTVLTLSGSLTDTNPDNAALRYKTSAGDVPGDADSGSGAIADSESNALEARENIPVSDGIAPTASFALTDDRAVTVTFSEEVSSSDNDASHWTISGADAAGLSILSVSSLTSTTGTMTVALDGDVPVPSTDLKLAYSAGGTIQDGANLALAAVPATAVSDDRRPSILSATAVNPAATGPSTIVVVFTRDVSSLNTQPDIAAAWSVSGADATVNGSALSVSGASSLSVSTKTLTLTLDGRLPDTRPDLDIAYDSTPASGTAVSIADANSRAMADASVAVADGIAPAVEKAEITGPTTITITYGEAVTAGQSPYSPATVDNQFRQISNVSGSGTAVHTLTFTNPAGTGAAGSVTIAEAEITDESGNAMTRTTGALTQPLADGQKPTITSARATSLTTIEVTFSENVKATGTAGTGGWSISGGDSASRLVYTRSGISSTASDTLVLTLDGNLTDTKPEGVKLAYDSSSGDVADDAGTANELDSASDIDVSDGVKPEIESAKVTGPRQITIAYSETVTHNLAHYNNINVGGSRFASGFSGANTDTAVLSFAGSNTGTDATGTVQINFGAIRDGSNNALGSGTVTQTLTDGQAPTFTAEATELDKITVTFSENLSILDTTAQGWSVSGTDAAGRTVDSSTPVSNGRSVVLTLSSDMEDTKPDGVILRYEVSGTDVGSDVGSGSGAIADPASNALEAKQSTAVSDGIKPEIESAKVTGPGQFTITYSEAVTASQSHYGSASVGGQTATVSSISGQTTATHAVSFTAPNPVGTGATGSVQINAAQVKDGSNNALGTSTALSQDLKDGQSPSVASATVADRRTIQVAFSESVRLSGAGTAPFGWAISGADAASRSVLRIDGLGSSAAAATLVLNGDIADKTNPAVTVAYSGGNIEDTSDNDLAAYAAAAADDGIAPRIESAAATSLTTIEVAFSEPVSVTGNAQGWSVSGADADGLDVTASTATSSGLSTVLTLSGALADTNPDNAVLRYKTSAGNVGSDASSGSGDIADLASNALEARASIPVSDGIAPTASFALTDDSAITVSFSEAVSSSSNAASNWAVSGTDAAGRAISSVSAISGSAMTVQLGGAALPVPFTDLKLAYDGGGAITDGASLVLAAIPAAQVADERRPAVTSAEATGPRTIVVTFSRDVSSSASAQDLLSAWSVSGGDADSPASLRVSGLSPLGSETRSMTVTLDGDLPDTKPDGVVLSFDATPSPGTTVEISDSSSRSLADASVTVSDGIAPEVESAEATGPRTIVATFSEAVMLSGAGTAPFGWAISGTDANSAEVDSIQGISESVSGTSATLNLDRDIAGATNPSVTVAYSGGNIEDTSGNDLAAYAATAADDGIAPTVTSVTATSRNTIAVAFSEPVRLDPAGAPTGWTLSGTDAASRAVSTIAFGSPASTATLTLDGDIADTTNPAVTVAYSGGNLEDASGNDLAAYAAAAAADGIAPTFTARATALDTIAVTFSESVTATGTPAPAGRYLAATGTRAPCSAARTYLPDPPRLSSPSTAT